MSWWYDLKKKQYYWMEVKIGAVVFLANLVTALVFFLLASLIALAGVSAGALGFLKGDPAGFSTTMLAGIGIFGILLIIVMLYLSLVIRGWVFQKVVKGFKLKI